MLTTCRNGHQRELGKKCRECARVYNAAYRKAHPELLDASRRYYQTHKPRCLENAQRWKDNNPERNADKIFRRLYGISKAQRDAMIEAQGGRCAICSEKPATTLHVDHDHQTGKVRRMLCRRCNHQLGFIEKNRELITRMFAYLKTHGDDSR